MSEGAKKTIFNNFKALKKLKEIKNIEVIIAVVLCAVILLIYFGSFGSTDLNADDQITKYTTTTDYASTLELRLENTLTQISGAGKVSVMITLETGPEMVIATSTDQKTNTTSSGDNHTENITVVENPIIVTANGQSTPLILMEILPQVKGVIVVAEGAGNIKVKLDLLNAIQALLNVPNDNIQIFEGN